MGHPIGRRRCICASPIPLSTILFLSWFLPSSSFAQISNTTPLLATNPTDPASSSSNTPYDQPDVSSADNMQTNQKGTHAFNYYFLIIAVLACCICLALFYITRRRKRKAELLRFHGQHALARDLEGWRGRLGVGRTGGFTSAPPREEGLNERGEAPPPYMAGSKPPSIRSTDATWSARQTGTEDVELRHISTIDSLPGYEQAASGHDGSISGITRPSTAIVAGNRRSLERV